METYFVIQYFPSLCCVTCLSNCCMFTCEDFVVVLLMLFRLRLCFVMLSLTASPVWGS